MQEKEMKHGSIELCCERCGKLSQCDCDHEDAPGLYWGKWDEMERFWVQVENPPPEAEIPEALLQRFGRVALLNTPSIRRKREGAPHVFVSDITPLENNGVLNALCVYLNERNLKVYAWTFSCREDGRGGFASKLLCQVRLDPDWPRDPLDEAKEAIAWNGFSHWCESLDHLIRLV